MGDTGPKAQNFIWATEHIRSKHEISVKFRPDRAPLCALYEQGKQVLQVRLDTFGDIKSDKDDEIKKAKDPRYH